MRKQVFGRKLKRDIDERKALIKGLLSELVMHERIQTTEQKAKAIKADADKLITKAKYKDRLHAYSLLQPLVSSLAVNKLLNDLAPRFSERAGGYTRIIKIQRRFNDNARMALIEWTEKKDASATISATIGSNKSVTTKRANKPAELTATIAKPESKEKKAETKKTEKQDKKITKKETKKEKKV